MSLRIAGSCLFFLFALAGAPQSALGIDEAAHHFDQANRLYRAGEYREAAELFERIVSNGYESAALFYNLGNAHFKLQNFPAAILAYERARRIAPHDEDIAYNLRLANLRVIDKIEPIPDLLFVVWWRAFLNALSSEGWAIVAIVAIWFAVTASAIVFVVRSLAVRKAALAVTVLGVLFAAASFVGSIQQVRQERPGQSAIVFERSIPVKSAPDPASIDLFVVHEGLKVDILDQVGEWRKIRLADGKMGWLPLRSIEPI